MSLPPTPSPNNALAHSIPQRLSRAWALLCGQERAFEWNAEDCVPPLSEFSYLLSLDFLGTDDKAGIAIALSPLDAHDLASAMFQVPLAQLKTHDVHDACMEVCNVLADTLSDLVADKDSLQCGLPQPLETNGYQQLLSYSPLRCSLRSTSRGEVTYFLVFNPLNPSFETRPAAL